MPRRQTMCVWAALCGIVLSHSMQGQKAIEMIDTPSATPGSGVERPMQAEPVTWAMPSIAITAGSLGAGIEAAVPVNRKVAIRGGFHMLDLALHFKTSDIPYEADAYLRSATVQVDFFPRKGNFHISPGLMVYNGMHGDAHAVIPAGQSFDMGYGTYVSSATSPVKADATLRMGYSTTPMLTFGWRSILPGRWRWTMPVEIGAVYIGTPKFTLNMSGVACDQNNNCGDLSTEPEAQADLQRERDDWADTIQQVKAYPIISIGVGYRFGSRGTSY